MKRETKMTNNQSGATGTSNARGREMSADTRELYSHSTNKIFKVDPESSIEMTKMSKDEQSSASIYKHKRKE